MSTSPLSHLIYYKQSLSFSLLNNTHIHKLFLFLLLYLPLIKKPSLLSLFTFYPVPTVFPSFLVLQPEYMWLT